MNTAESQMAVQVGFAGPADQRRLTVAFRLILIIPLAILLIIADVALAAVEVISWFAALVLGRLPRWAAGFLTVILRLNIRVYAYGYLLTDRYPPLHRDRDDYPVDVRTSPGRLNRLAVLFRVVLVIPTYIVSTVLSSGLPIVLFFTWLIVVVAGRMPASLHQALCAVLRYQARYYAYFGLLTSTYPAGILGDPPGQAPGAYPPPPEVAPTWAPPLLSPPPFSPPPFSPPPFSPPPLSPPDAKVPLATRLVLSRPAKRIVVLVLILGGLSIAGSITLDVVVTRSATLRVQEDYAALTRSISQYVDQAGQCPAQPDPLSCADRAAISQAAAFATFGQQVSEITFPQQRAATDATRVVRDANQLATLYQRVSSAPSVAAYERDFRVLEPVAHTFDSSYRTLANDLGIG